MRADPQSAVLKRLSYRRQNLSRSIPRGSVRRRGEGGGRGGAGRVLPPSAPASSAPRATAAAVMGVAAGRRRRWGVPVLLLAYLGYVGLGAGVLQALERPAEVRAARRLLQQRWELLANHTCLQGPALQRLIQGIIEAYKSGVTLQGNTTSLGRWDFSGSFFFSISAITTIGYGNLSPSTVAGRIFCIFFALFGIPLNLVLLNEIGQLMLLGVQRSAHHLEEMFHWKIKAALLMKTCALVTGLLLFLLLPPLLFSNKEGWTYEESFYYSFITLSTIGFGDYVIGMNPDRTYPSWYKNVISLWILFGMAWLALIIKCCINLLESSSDFCQCNRKSIELSEDEMDDGKKSMTGLHNVESCNDKDTKAGGPGGYHTHTTSTEAL
ncbi:potassium channel subfamily K member 17 isoform X2 [Gallus gallus]|uniref:potassium channel subfamily K member 17 isoform X2 n=1 Tax=Gallus gallus TaxID=9031 RepID=UPI001AE1FF82|nr:potassium channel subfamily K member 17 isoform X2 [Gallus gallus]